MYPRMLDQMYVSDSYVFIVPAAKMLSRAYVLIATTMTNSAAIWIIWNIEKANIFNIFIFYIYVSHIL